MTMWNDIPPIPLSRSKDLNNNNSVDRLRQRNKNHVDLKIYLCNIEQQKKMKQCLQHFEDKNECPVISQQSLIVNNMEIELILMINAKRPAKNWEMNKNKEMIIQVILTDKDLTLSINSNKYVELNKFIVNLHAKLSK